MPVPIPLKTKKIVKKLYVCFYRHILLFDYLLLFFRLFFSVLFVILRRRESVIH